MYCKRFVTLLLVSLLQFIGNQPYATRAMLFYDNIEKRKRTTEEVVNSTVGREFYDILHLAKTVKYPNVLITFTADWDILYTV